MQYSAYGGHRGGGGGGVCWGESLGAVVFLAGLSMVVDNTINGYFAAD